MKRIKFLFIVMTAIIVSSCGSGNNKQPIPSNDAREVSIRNNSETYVVIPEASYINWKGSKPTGEHIGTIKLSSGELYHADGILTSGEFEVDMRSIKDEDLKDPDDNAKLVGHLKSPDFFSVDSFPTASFAITNIQPLEVSESGANFMVTGNLTIKGISKSINFPANIKITDAKIVAESDNFTINRANWNVRFGSKTFFNNLQNKFINDEVALKVVLEAEREKE